MTAATFTEALQDATKAAETAVALQSLDTGRVLYGFNSMPLVFVVAVPEATTEQLAIALVEQFFVQAAMTREAMRLMPCAGGEQ